MGSALDFAKNVFTFATSSVDVGSDVITSLDFLGYNISSTVFIQTITDLVPFNKSEKRTFTDIIVNCRKQYGIQDQEIRAKTSSFGPSSTLK